MKFFNKTISLYRLLLSIPKQLNELKKMNYSLIELNQKLIFEYYKNDTDTINLNDKGFRVHSQFEEDGLLLFIFSKIGFSNKKGVEMCCGWGNECMLSNLILYHGFEALLFDGDENSVERARTFFNNHPNTFQHPPKVLQQWITKDNVIRIIKENGFEGEVDIFSLDVDGIDFYLMKELNVINPRVVICEVHNVIPSSLSLTIPYSDDFDYTNGKFDPEFRSVSLLGMVNLMKNKGYRLIGCHKYGFNVIFLRNNVGIKFFPEINPEQCFENAYTRERSKVWSRVAAMPWEIV